MRSSAFAAALLALIIVACSSESDPGEGCDGPGGTDGVCADGTVCGHPFEKNKSRGFACIPICFEDKDCGKGYHCKDAVDGAFVKGCRLKD